MCSDAMRCSIPSGNMHAIMQRHAHADKPNTGRTHPPAPPPPLPQMSQIYCITHPPPHPAHSPLVQLVHCVCDEGQYGGRHFFVHLDVRLHVVLEIREALAAIQGQLAQLVCGAGRGAAREGSGGWVGGIDEQPAGVTSPLVRICWPPLLLAETAHTAPSTRPQQHRRHAPANTAGRLRSPTRTPLRVALEA